jgi:beta-mannosidase
MKLSFTIILLFFFAQESFSQPNNFSLKDGWMFSKAGSNDWHTATVPGSVYTDLINNKIIGHPFFGKNEENVRWVDSATWMYEKNFSLTDVQFENENLSLVFEGLDTYADIYLNDKLLGTTNNMFRRWSFPVTDLLQDNNVLKVVFHSALMVNDSLAKVRYKYLLPSDNRVHARKAAYQFGWDWGPTLVNCGIWKKVHIEFGDKQENFIDAKPMAQLITQKDKKGERFFFKVGGRKVYIKGANWIPASSFPSSVTDDDYRKLLVRAKQANMNMLRVWGGGIYESDYFYDLCDSLGIMVWQDFMFAGGMYPGTKDFMNNVREEVKQQILRLKKHPSIVLWCGNNEIEEGWKHWGWQNQFYLHGDDSIEVWSAYKTLFQDSLPAWVERWDGNRKYVSTSPRYGWGNEKSYTEGDSHYWGLWWGLQPWEVWKEKTGRFVSEYGMQSASSFNFMQKWLPKSDTTFSSPAFQWHQKANEGNIKLHHYLNQYFLDSSKLPLLNMSEYIYVTQCMQHYILTNSIASHMAKRPYNMGTLLWQLNDSWPAISWSILNFDATPKAAYYAVKNAYANNKEKFTTKVYPKNWQLDNPEIRFKWLDNTHIEVLANADAYYVFVTDETQSFESNDNFFNLKKGQRKILTLQSARQSDKVKIISWYDIVAKLNRQ